MDAHTEQAPIVIRLAMRPDEARELYERLREIERPDEGPLADLVRVLSLYRGE